MINIGKIIIDMVQPCWFRPCKSQYHFIQSTAALPQILCPQRCFNCE